MRIVSLTCSNTEIVAALGLAHLLVGVDDPFDWPMEVVGRLPRLVEGVRALREVVAAVREGRPAPE